MMEFEPEPDFALKSRYKDALEPVYDQKKIADGDVATPGSYRKHVFDFLDGCRLIVSREKAPCGKVILHASASFRKEFTGRDRDVQELVVDVLQKLNDLRGKQMMGVAPMMIDNGVIHIMYDENQLFPMGEPMWN